MVGVSCMVVVGLAGCSTDDLIQTASPFSEKQALCDLRPGTPQCTDIRKFSGPSLMTFEQVCGTLKGSKQDATGYKEGATCPTTEMLGGCQTKNGDGSLQTNWFYKSTKYPSETEAKAECDSNTEWVGPQ